MVIMGCGPIGPKALVSIWKGPSASQRNRILIASSPVTTHAGSVHSCCQLKLQSQSFWRPRGMVSTFQMRTDFFQNQVLGFSGSQQLGWCTAFSATPDCCFVPSIRRQFSREQLREVLFSLWFYHVYSFKLK